MRIPNNLATRPTNPQSVAGDKDANGCGTPVPRATVPTDGWCGTPATPRTNVPWCGTPPGPAVGRGSPIQAVDVSATTDPAFRMGVTGARAFDVHVGIGGPITAAGGELGVKLDGQIFSVPTQAGQSAVDALKALRQRLETAGYTVTVTNNPSFDSLDQSWSLSK